MTPTYEQLRDWFTPARERRFWAKVDKQPGPFGCWLWRGSRTDDGHGQTYCCGGNVRVHRFMWLLARQRDIPEFIFDSRKGEYVPFVVRHLMCDHSLCCNPSHLVGGCQAENVKDIWLIHHAYQQDVEEQARREYLSHPYAGYFSDKNLTGDIGGAQHEHRVGFPMHTPAMPMQSVSLA